MPPWRKRSRLVPGGATIRWLQRTVGVQRWTPVDCSGPSCLAGVERSTLGASPANTASCDLPAPWSAFPPGRLANAVGDRSLVGLHRRQPLERDSPTEPGHAKGWGLGGTILDLQPDRAQRTPPAQAIGGGGPEAAAVIASVVGPPPPDRVLQLVLAIVGRDHEEHVMLLSVAKVLEVADVGGDLLAHPVHRFGRAIPLQVEEDAPAIGEIDPAAVRRRRGPFVLARRRAALGPDLLLAMPEQQSLVSQLPAPAGQGDEELVGLQVVEGVPAVVAGVVAALDVCARVLTVPVGEHPGSPRRDQE